MKASTLDRLFGLWTSGEAVKAGREVFDWIEPDQRPGWAADILEWCANRCGVSFDEVRDVCAIGRDPSRWPEGHTAFSRVRAQTLLHDRPGTGRDPLAICLLYVAEIAAKVTYNETTTTAPFDHDSGWWMAVNLRSFVEATADTATAETEAWDLLLAPLRGRADAPE